MQKVIKIITNDGMSFDTEKAARKHVDIKYGDKLSRIAHKILAHDKYVSLCEFIDANIDIFAELILLKNELNGNIEDNT